MNRYDISRGANEGEKPDDQPIKEDSNYIELPEFKIFFEPTTSRWKVKVKVEQDWKIARDSNGYEEHWTNLESAKKWCKEKGLI